MPKFKYSNYTLSEEKIKDIENSYIKFKKGSYTFSNKEILKIKELRIKGYTVNYIAKKYNCTTNTIYVILRDKNII